MNKKIRQVICHNDGDFKEFYFFKIGELCKDVNNAYKAIFDMPTYFNDKDGSDIYENDYVEIYGKRFVIMFFRGTYMMVDSNGIKYPIIPDLVKVCGHFHERSNKY